MIYNFGEFELNSSTFQLFAKDELVTIEPKTFDLILYLLENRTRLISRQELFEQLWSNREVSDTALSNHINSARKALGDDGQQQQTIKTIHGRGYQFIGVVAPKEVSLSEIITLKNKPSLGSFAILLSVIVILFVLFTYSPNPLMKQNYVEQAIDDVKTVASTETSVAVLAFRDLSENQNMEYLADGISEELLNLLSKIPNLRVISRTTSFSYKNKSITINEIGKQLNVDYVLDGSVRRASDNLRITTQLISTSDDSHLWSETYNGELENIFKIQDEIAISVASHLELSLHNILNEAPVVNPEAYTYYLHARALFSQFNQETNRKADKIIKKSLSIEPDYSPSWVLLSRIKFVAALSFGNEYYVSEMAAAEQAAQKAINLDKNNAKAYASLARIMNQNRHFDSADSNIRKALLLGNNNIAVLNIAALNKRYEGQFDKALEYRNRITQIDPNNYSNLYNLGYLYYLSGQYSKAISSMSTFTFYKPDAAASRFMLCKILLSQNKPIEAYAEAEKEKNSFWRLYAMNISSTSLGDSEHSDQLLNLFIEKYGKTKFAYVADIYAYRNESEKALNWLAEALIQGDTTLLEVVNSPAFKPVHNTPKWKTLLLTMKLPEEHWLLNPGRNLID